LLIDRAWAWVWVWIWGLLPVCGAAQLLALSCACACACALPSLGLLPCTVGMYALPRNISCRSMFTPQDGSTPLTFYRVQRTPDSLMPENPVHNITRTLLITLNCPFPLLSELGLCTSSSNLQQTNVPGAGRDIFNLTKHAFRMSNLIRTPTMIDYIHAQSHQKCMCGGGRLFLLTPQAHFPALYQLAPIWTFLLSPELLLFLPSCGCHLGQRAMRCANDEPLL
jgi:hypothetical protein